MQSCKRDGPAQPLLYFLFVPIMCSDPISSTVAGTFHGRWRLFVLFFACSHVDAEATLTFMSAIKPKQPKQPKRTAPHPASVSLCPPRRPLPPHALVLAPMVGASELAFRLLCRRHGAQLCYTPMMHSSRFASDAAYRAAELCTAQGDGPLVAHFCGNDGATLLAAARLAERASNVVAVDLNLGCPQRSAHSGHYGAFLCADAAGRERVLGMVSTLAHGLSVPVFCKIRLLDEGEAETVAFAQALERAGCALLAVHGRLRGIPTVQMRRHTSLDVGSAGACPLSRRQPDAPEERACRLGAGGCGQVGARHPGARKQRSTNASCYFFTTRPPGAGADQRQCARRRRAARGNLLRLHLGAVSEPSRKLLLGELLAALAATGADGVMSAEGALDDPAIFGRAAAAAARRRRRLRRVVRAAQGAEPPSAGTAEALALRRARRRLRRLRRLPLPRGDAATPAVESADELDLADEYLGLARLHAAPLSCAVFHLRRMCRDRLKRCPCCSSHAPVWTGPLPTTALFTLRRRALSGASCSSRSSRRARSTAPAASSPAAARSQTAAALPSCLAARLSSPTRPRPRQWRQLWRRGRTCQPKRRWRWRGRRRERRARASGRRGRRGCSGARRRGGSSAKAAWPVSRAGFSCRRARAEGKPDDHYTSAGLAPPTEAEVAGLQALPADELPAAWAKQYGRHCRERYVTGRRAHDATERRSGASHLC